MGLEIERKFLVTGSAWRQDADSVVLRQSYLSADPERTVRVRIESMTATLTIKGKSIGATRHEWEYQIPLEDANQLLDMLCQGPLIEKRRHKIRQGDLMWEVDEFLGENAGLVVAEIELASEDQPFDKPDWLGREVTGDARYFNSSLMKQPFSRWPAETRAGED